MTRAATRTPDRALRTLIVDDSAAVRRSISRALAPMHAVVVATDSAASALNLLGVLPTPRFDVVTCDLNLPGMHGLDLISAVQRRFKARAPRIVVISAYCDDQAIARELQAAGITRLLSKPFFPREIREAIAGAPHPKTE